MNRTIKVRITMSDRWPAYPGHRQTDTITSPGDILDVEWTPSRGRYRFIDQHGAWCALAPNTFEILSPIEQLARIDD